MKKCFFPIVLCLLCAVPLFAAPKVDAGGFLERGLRCYRQYDLDGAIKEFTNGLAVVRSAKNARYEEGLSAGLGLVYRSRGDYRKAVYYTGEALAVAEHQKDKQRVAVDLVNLGIINALMDNQQKALSCYDDALRVLRERRDNVGVGVILLQSADAYAKQGLRQKAISCLNEALRIFTAAGKRTETGDAFLALGDLYRHFDEYSRAVAYYESSLKTGRELQDRRLTARSLSSLGAVEYARANYDRSVACLNESLELTRGLNDPKGTVDNLNELGRIYLDLKDYRNAVFSCTKAVEIARGVDSDLLVGESLENLGLAYRATGDYSKALSCLVQAVTSKEKAGLPVTAISAIIADCYLDAGELDKAEDAYLNLGDAVRLGRLQLARKNYKRAIHYFSAVFEGNVEDRAADAVFASYTGIGHACAALGDNKSAEENYTKAVTLLEEQELFPDRQEALRFSAGRIRGFSPAEPYEGLVKSLVQLGRHEEALRYAENLKLRNFSRLMLDAPQTKEGRGIAPAMAQEEDADLVKIHSLEKEATALRHSDNAEDRETADQELHEAKERHVRFVDRLRKSYPEYASLRYPVAAPPHELKLRKNETLLEFEVTGDETYLFMENGTTGRVRSRRIGLSRAAIEQLVTTYLSSLGQHGRSTDAAAAPSPRKLFNALFGTGLDDIPAGAALLIVPDELLGVLPFESLVIEDVATVQNDSGENTSARVFRNMGDKWHISYAQSATWLSLLRARERYADSGSGVLSLYDVATSTVSVRAMGGRVPDIFAAIDAWQAYGRKYDEMLDSGTSDTRRQPDAAARRIATDLQVVFGADAAALTGRRTDEESIADVAFTGHKYIFLGMQCLLDDTVPYIKQPFFILPAAFASERYGRVLSVAQVAGLHIPAEVVAIPFSENGPVDDSSGQGPLAMARALQTAGCDSVLLSLWRTSDDATTALSTAFFKNLAQGDEAATALEQAKKYVRRHGFDHPFYWAGFILAGK